MPGEGGKVRIRPAEIDDAPGLARVNVRSWQHAYRGILPDSFLDGLDIAASESRWEGLLRFPTERGATFLAELTFAKDRPRAEVIGFATGGPERDGLVADGIGYDGEIYAIYLAPEHQRRGIGRLLLAATVRSLTMYGMKSVVIWALKDNHAARAFYEGLGGRVVGERMTKIRGIYELPEVGYGWPDAGCLASRA